VHSLVAIVDLVTALSEDSRRGADPRQWLGAA
jgi:hypothetical protein